MHTNNGRALAVRDDHQLARAAEPDPHAFEPTTVQGALDLLSQIVPTGLLPRHIRTPQAGLLQLILGRERGLSLMQSLMGLHVIEGVPSMKTELLAALVKQSPVCEYLRVVEADATHAIAEGKRRGGEPVRMTWTIEDARNAGLAGKDNWKKYPKRMLTWRALSDVIKLEFPDVCQGTAPTEELMDEAGTATVVAPPPQQDPATGPAGLKALLGAGASVAAMPDPRPAPAAKAQQAKVEDAPAPSEPDAPAELVGEPAEDVAAAAEDDAGKLSAERHHELRTELAALGAEFKARCDALGIPTDKARNLWTGRVVGVVGVKTLQGCRSEKAFAERLQAGRVLCERAQLAVEVQRVHEVWPAGSDSVEWMREGAPALLEDPFRHDLEQIHIGLAAALKQLEAMGVEHQLEEV